MENKINYSLIVAILNRGFSDVAMSAARSAGAKGGTVISAKSSGLHEEETFFGISILPEKEVVLILTSDDTKNAIMRAIMDESGTGTKAGAIVFSLPVTDTAGMRMMEEIEEELQSEEEATAVTE